jgi:hypothetical protein
MPARRENNHGGERSRPIIFSGGQSGVDRAALDAALNAGAEIGGWCPAGRGAEDGPIPARYALRESRSPAPETRTRLNIRDSDATLIIVDGIWDAGTRLTRTLAEELDRPYHVADLAADADPTAVAGWLNKLEIRVLNIAGPRESESPGIGAKAQDFVGRLLAEL